VLVPKTRSTEVKQASKPPKAAAKKRAVGLVQELQRDPGLEAAIIEAPLDPVPRMVYADWLQAAGDRRGEWMALASAIERDPKNVRLRSLAVEFLGAHRELLLGEGAALLPGAWIGWRGGFIDEIRVQSFANAKHVVGAFASLLAHPSCRFVRCVGIGAMGKDTQGAVAALVEAAPPLLESVVVCDGGGLDEAVDIDALAALPTVRRLGLHQVHVERAMPQLVELSCKLGGHVDEWVAAGKCSALESLTVDCREVEVVDRIVRVLRAVPAVRELRLLHLAGADEVMDSVAALPQLARLDVSHSTVTDAGLARLRGRTVEVIALRTYATGGGVVSPKVHQSARMDRLDYDHEESGGWMMHRIATDGRDGVALMPGIGSVLFSVGTQHSMNDKAALATPLLDASLTLPNANVKTWAWANAAIAHERLLELDDAELIAREGMLRAPREPNLFAIVIDALRRSDRLEQAVAMLPKAFASIRAPKGPGAHSGGPAACLCDCLMTLAQAGRHREVLEQAEEYADVVDVKPHIHAIIAMSHVALRDLDAARAAIEKMDPKGIPGLAEHARAVMSLAGKAPKLARAIELLRSCKEARYPEWHWIARDPNLVRLADVPEFRALL
jgi:uncharacterized protein (TIGR02996 family)